MKKSLLLAVLGLTLSLAACGKAEEKETKDIEQSEGQTDEQGSGGEEASNSFFEVIDGKIDHIHGMGYPGNQGKLFFAAHDGLKVYDNGKWYKTKEENNDYMGFNATKDGFYTSGHPGQDSSLPNPLGIQKSTDDGQTLEQIAVEGETDFHLMGVGYEKPMIFLMNLQKNSIMEAGRFYLSEDNATTWKEVSANGLDDKLLSVAVHPQKANYLAASGQQGIYLSKDKGENFELISGSGQGTSVFFTNESLIYGTYDGTAKLTKLSLSDETEEEIPLPELKEDAVMYFAQNPKNEQEMAFVSFNGDIYHTTDGANNWDSIVEADKSK
ncbi:hypothetical protein J7I93_22255 [Bacillus sp. ISL-47]|uniref:F510_1955 family glycosylhydrolase n=1 Tax=Bacillus sp. ISL-47 TaxID=2819130 RepID=UPI001BE91FD8|nr:hypothetical protein [Bacillus sp. ISL-47]MBT2690865.1 hypothetical protein [Bacillus sp. ISL-47]MBT2710974.1 hypothetical protein [Pseudomonas sp. ISL-84]